MFILAGFVDLLVMGEIFVSVTQKYKLMDALMGLSYIVLIVFL